MKLTQRLKRPLYFVAAVALSLTGLFTTFVERAAATGQVTSRAITISKSAISAIHVEYKIAFTNATNGNVGGVAVDFCSNDPIIGDACTAPTGLNTNFATTTVSAQTGLSGFSVDATGSTANTIIITNATPQNLSSPTAVTLSLGDDSTTGFTNPSTVGSFYARIYTYATKAAAEGHSPGTPSGYVDYGGDALSTVAVINITAKVQETLVFCVYPHLGSCGTDPSFTLGHTVGGGSTIVIDNTAVDTSQVDFSLSTNANGGVIVRLKGDTLKAGANDINAAGTSSVTPSAGTELFGVDVSTAGTSITPTSPYDGTGGNAGKYALDTSSGTGANVTSTFGGQLCQLTAPANNSVSTLTFAATASPTTPAGTYTAAEQLIATGTF
ncbi:MAG TPA: hypothetical protein VLH84_01850 [Patescibacteria group bacterium]|nr:hypothetical protein [Patescibacteria group bacterium]